MSEIIQEARSERRGAERIASERFSVEWELKIWEQVGMKGNKPDFKQLKGMEGTFEAEDEDALSSGFSEIIDGFGWEEEGVWKTVKQNGNMISNAFWLINDKSAGLRVVSPQEKAGMEEAFASEMEKAKKNKKATPKEPPKFYTAKIVATIIRTIEKKIVKSMTMGKDDVIDTFGIRIDV